MVADWRPEALAHGCRDGRQRPPGVLTATGAGGMSASAQPSMIDLPSMMTVAEFLELPDELVEPDNGVVVDRAAASPRQGALQA